MLVTTSFSGSNRMDNVLKDHRCPTHSRFWNEWDLRMSMQKIGRLEDWEITSSSPRIRRLRCGGQMGGNRKGASDIPDAPCRLCSLTVAEFYRSYLSTPIERPRRKVVLLRIPEGTAIGGINRHAAVIAPAVRGIGLRARAADDALLGLHLAERIGINASGEGDGRIDG